MKREKVISLAMDTTYLVIGFLAMLASIKFSYKFFRYNGHPIIWSVIISIVYVLFLNLIFEAAISIFVQIREIKLERNKQREQSMIKRYNKLINKQKAKGSLIMLSWLLLIFYSVISTVGGQYDQLSQLNIDYKEDAADSKKQTPIIQDQIELLEKQKVLYIKEMDAIAKRLTTVENIEKSYTYKNTSSKNEERLDELREKTMSIDTKIMNYRSKIIEIEMKSNNITSGNVYKYFERVTKIPGYIIQFVLSFFPSIVLDFFAPISFAMVIFRNRG